MEFVWSEEVFLRENQVLATPKFEKFYNLGVKRYVKMFKSDWIIEGG